MEILAARLDTAMRRRNLTDRDVADAVNALGVKISHAYIVQLRTGQRDNPTVRHLKALAEVLQEPAWWLLGEDDPAADAPPAGRIEEMAADIARLSATSQRAISHHVDMALRAETARPPGPAPRSSPVSSHVAGPIPSGTTHPFPHLEVQQAFSPPHEPGNTIGQRLRNLRAMAKLSMSEAGQTLGTPVRTIEEIETGQRTPTEAELTVLLSLYGISDAEQRNLVLEVARGEHRDAWWLDHFVTTPLWFTAMLAAETGAHTIKGYAVDGIPALLQTEAYAKAARQAAHDPSASSEQIAFGARIVLQRQAGPVEQQSARLWFVIREAALLDMPGNADLQAEQLAHLIDIAKSPKTTLRIIPLGSGGYRPRGGSFTIFQRSGKANLVYVAGLAEDALISAPVLTDEYSVAHFYLDSSAAPVERTVEILTHLRNRIFP